MVDGNSSPWPQTVDGKTDWETVFEDPKTGLIALIAQARSPAALRKTTAFVIETIYAQGGAPPEITGFVDELEHMLPNDLPDETLPKITDAISTVMREIKDDRIRREENPFDGLDDDSDEEDAPKKKKWWNRKKKPKKAKKPKKSVKKPARADKKGQAGKPARMIIFGGLVLLLGLAGIGGGGYYYFFANHDPVFNERTRTLIDQMVLAAAGNGPEHHIFGWPLIVENRADLIGVTAIGVPAAACTSIAWYFVNRGNVLINDRLPEKIAPNILKRFCEEKGQTAKVLWLSKAPSSTEKASSGIETDKNTTGNIDGSSSKN